MTKIYDADAASNDAVPPRPRSRERSDFLALPDIYEPRRRRLPPMVLAGGLFIAAATAFFGAEEALPPDYKPSHFIGGYQRSIAKARAEGELKARIVYDGRLKLIETDAVRWQERCRAGLQNANNLYQAAYSRANMYAQATADMQKQYVATRYNIAQQTVSGEIGAANMATTFGFIAGLFDPDVGQKSMQLAEAARQQALHKLDDAAKSGVTVSVEGWNTGLPEPTALPAANACELPASLSAPQPSSEG